MIFGNACKRYWTEFCIKSVRFISWLILTEHLAVMWSGCSNCDVTSALAFYRH